MFFNSYDFLFILIIVLKFENLFHFKYHFIVFYAQIIRFLFCLYSLTTLVIKYMKINTFTGSKATYLVIFNNVQKY